MWLKQYPDEAGHQRSLKTRFESPEFKAVRDEMKTLISHADWVFGSRTDRPWNQNFFLWRAQRLSSLLRFS